MKKFEEHTAQHDAYNYSREDPFYIVALSKDAMEGLDDYVKNIPKDDEQWWSCKQDHFEKDGTVKEKNFRVCDIHAPQRNSFPHMVGMNMFNFVNKKNYQMDISTFEFQILRYRAGGQFSWHCDYGIAPKTDVWRKLSISVQLSSPEEYEGGDLVLVDYFNQHCEIPKSKGASVVFDARCPHKAFPLTSGERLVLVGWASGPKLK